MRISMERACASRHSSRARRATLAAFAFENAGDAAMMLVFLQKVSTDRADEKRAVPIVGRT